MDEDEEKLNIPFNRFYLHFPWIYYEAYGFGSNDSGKLGLKDLKMTPEPKILSGLGKKKIIGIYSGMNHTIVFLIV